MSVVLVVVVVAGEATLTPEGLGKVLNTAAPLFGHYPCRLQNQNKRKIVCV
jgi:hypothetical protein